MLENTCQICGGNFSFGDSKNRKICNKCANEIVDRVHNKVIGICPVCGKKVPGVPNKRNTYCSKECLKIGNLALNLINRAGVYYRKPKMRTKLDDVALEAKKAGLHYGEYVARRDGKK